MSSLVKNQTVHYVEKSQQRRPDYITVFDPTVEYYMVDAAKYLHTSVRFASQAEDEV